MIATEILKLRTVRSPWLLVAAAQLVIVAGAAGAFANGDGTDAAIARAGAAHLGLTALFALVLGIMAVAGEHRHRTISDTYLSRPRRGEVLTAKLATYTGAGVAFGLLGAVTAVAATAVAATITGVTVDWSDPELWRTVGGGAANSAWTKIRERKLKAPFKHAESQDACAGVARLALQSLRNSG